MHHIDQIERRVATAQVAAAVAASMGAKDVSIPNPDVAIADFDAWLISEPKAVDREKQELLKVMGVA